MDVVEDGSPPATVLVMYTLYEPASARANGLIVYEDEVAPLMETPPNNH